MPSARSSILIQKIPLNHLLFARPDLIRALANAGRQGISGDPEELITGIHTGLMDLRL
jgi:hypothetical protein